MSKSMIELPDGSNATEAEALAALVREAKKRGISYGQLVATTTEWDRNAMVKEYCMEKRKKGRKQ